MPPLLPLCAQMERRREELHVTDWGITETTLEQVFHKITDAAAQQQRAGSRVRSLSEVCVPACFHRRTCCLRCC